jgi:hypothetical protein
VLAFFRPSLDLVRAEAELDDVALPLPVEVPPGRLVLDAGAPSDQEGVRPLPVEVPPDWLARRAIGTFRLLPGRWLDLRRLETFQALRVAIPAPPAISIRDVDLGAVCGPERAFTQAIARWAYERGFQGIAYTSRHDARFHCWALFDTATIQPVGGPVPLTPADPDLRTIARLFGLGLPTAGGGPGGGSPPPALP